MGTAYFITHPEVAVDPHAPVPSWHLSETGRARMVHFAQELFLRRLEAIWSSDETKAIEAAAILAAHLQLATQIHAGLRENDRSATGFLPPPEFEQAADAFFARPEDSVRGWEKAVDAQVRIVAAVEEVLGRYRHGDIAFVAHGGVGTLLLCRYLGQPVSRSFDQPFQGHVWSFDIATRRVLERWRSIAPR